VSVGTYRTCCNFPAGKNLAIHHASTQAASQDRLLSLTVITQKWCAGKTPLAVPRGAAFRAAGSEPWLWGVPGLDRHAPAIPAYLQAVTMISTSTSGAAISACTQARTGAPAFGSRGPHFVLLHTSAEVLHPDDRLQQPRLVGAVLFENRIDLLQHIRRLSLDVLLVIPRGNAGQVDEAVILHRLRQDRARLGADDLGHEWLPLEKSTHRFLGHDAGSGQGSGPGDQANVSEPSSAGAMCGRRSQVRNHMAAHTTAPASTGICNPTSSEEAPSSPNLPAPAPCVAGAAKCGTTWRRTPRHLPAPVSATPPVPRKRHRPARPSPVRHE